jgi:CubicO group peptidase (beta-lactamase class C family)
MRGNRGRRAFLRALFHPFWRLRTAERKRLVAEVLERHGVPGAALVLLRDSRVTAIEVAGVRSAAGGEPVTEETIFEVASLSKPVFTLAVRELSARGVLDLDRPLTSYLPLPYAHEHRPWRPPGESEVDWVDDPRLSRITAKTVLTHTTGFPNWAFERDLALEFTPGERWQYSGEGFVFLQRVVERITGRPLDEHVNETVFAPLAMSSSSFLWKDRFGGRFATGHDRKGAPREKSRPVRALSAGSLHTTAPDYGRFLQSMLSPEGEGTVLQSLARPLVEVDEALGLSWGLGWGIAKRGAESFAWHWGSNPGFQSFVMISLRDRSGLLLLTNSENGLGLAGALAPEL